MGAPVLWGAGIGAVTSLIRGKDPLKGALIGGASGGLFGGSQSLFGSDIANMFGGEVASSGFNGIPVEAFGGGDPLQAATSGVDLMSNYNAGLPLETGFESGLTKIGSNAGYEAGMPFYNPADITNQNLNLIQNDMFKPANLGNMSKGEYLQPLGTDNQLSYADKIKNFGSDIYDYGEKNPDKMLMGGLQIGSLLTDTRQNDLLTQAKGAGINPAQIKGLIAPSQVTPMLSSYAPTKKKQFKIG
tara:strand:+ start:268 stop:999 length:732 start_codon:yes stop_codon:yes gene_type:complete